MGTFLPQRWTRQPVGPARLDPGHWSFGGTFDCALFNAASAVTPNLAYPGFLTAVGSPTSGQSQSGVGMATTGGTGAAIANHGSQVAGDFSVRVIHKPTSWASFATLFDKGLSGGARELSLFFSTTGATNFYAIGANGSAWTGTLTQAVGVEHDVVFTRKGTAVSLYVDGVADTVSATSSTTVQQASALTNIGKNISGGGANYAGIYLLYQAWVGRALTAVEVRELYRAKWAGFAPLPSRVYSFPTAIAYLLTVSASQAQIAVMARSIAATRSSAQVESASIVRSVAATRPAAQGSVAVKVRAISFIRSAVGATSPSLLRAIVVTRLAVQSGTAVAMRALSLLRATGAACAAAITRAVAATNAVAQFCAATMVRVISFIRSASASSSATSVRAVAATLAATQPQVSTILRACSAAIAANVATTSAIVRALASAIAAASIGSASLARSLYSIMTATQGSNATLARAIGRTMRATGTTIALLLRSVSRAFFPPSVACINDISQTVGLTDIARRITLSDAAFTCRVGDEGLACA